MEETQPGDWEEEVALKVRGHQKIVQLMEKGVDISNPLSLDVGAEINPDKISGDNVRIYPGCRIYGGETVIAPGAQIGKEGPVTIEDCQIGRNVELKGGYFERAVFLQASEMGSGAHVREGCILEEAARAAHCAGLKQTILFPFVTLGSLINFCDCLMAGGTGGKDHSEVGSSYIHFNFTPDGDKATASLIGDVPRGVMLSQRPIFLGGQGGMVGPVRVGYGNVVVAGTILRKDSPEDDRLIIGKAYREKITKVFPSRFLGHSRLIENNVLYLSNLTALEQWYLQVRRPLFGKEKFEGLIYSGAIGNLSLAKKERIKRIKEMVEKIPAVAEGHKNRVSDSAAGGELRERVEEVCALFGGVIPDKVGAVHRDSFLSEFEKYIKNSNQDYVRTVQGLPETVSQEGTRWLQEIVDELCRQAAVILPSMGLFKKKAPAKET